MAFLSGPGPGRDLPRTRSPSHSHPQKAAEVKEEKMDFDKCRRMIEHSAASKTEMGKVMPQTKAMRRGDSWSCHLSSPPLKTCIRDSGPQQLKQGWIPTNEAKASTLERFPGRPGGSCLHVNLGVFPSPSICSRLLVPTHSREDRELGDAYTRSVRRPTQCVMKR